MLETVMFQALGSFETLGSKLSHGTFWIAEIIHWIISPDVRNHIRKVSKNLLSQILISLYLKYSLFYYKDKLARVFLVLNSGTHLTPLFAGWHSSGHRSRLVRPVPRVYHVPQCVLRIKLRSDPHLG